MGCRILKRNFVARPISPPEPKSRLRICLLQSCRTWELPSLVYMQWNALHYALRYVYAPFFHAGNPRFKSHG
jgi:hypothetical protein